MCKIYETGEHAPDIQLVQVKLVDIDGPWVQKAKNIRFSQ